jgi:hypothetical protein
VSAARLKNTGRNTAFLLLLKCPPEAQNDVTWMSLGLPAHAPPVTCLIPASLAAFRAICGCNFGAVTMSAHFAPHGHVLSNTCALCARFSIVGPLQPISPIAHPYRHLTRDFPASPVISRHCNSILPSPPTGVGELHGSCGRVRVLRLDQAVTQTVVNPGNIQVTGMGLLYWSVLRFASFSRSCSVDDGSHPQPSL